MRFGMTFLPAGIINFKLHFLSFLAILNLMPRYVPVISILFVIFLFYLPVSAYSQKDTIPDELKEIYRSSYPKEVGDSLEGRSIPKDQDAKTNNNGQDQPTITPSSTDSSTGNAAVGYTFTNAAVQPQKYPPSTDIVAFFLNVLQSIGDWIGGLFGFAASYGTQQAYNWASGGAPKDVAGQVLTYQFRNGSSLAENGTKKVLGDDNPPNDAMKTALPFMRCAAVPWEICNGYSPVPTGSIAPTPPIQRTVCATGHGDCSPEFLSNYFHDMEDANIASRICQRESNSDPSVTNYGCTTGKSVDYSIGLFQINLLAYCPASKPTYTWDPPSCTFGDHTELAKCETELTDAIGNIKKAVEISQNGTNWQPWMTPNGCSIFDIPTGTPGPTIPASGYVYYSQRQSPYSTHPFDGCTLFRGGCGIVTTAMILSTFRHSASDGSPYDPSYIADTYYPDTPSCATNIGTAQTALAKNGFKTEWIFSGQSADINHLDVKYRDQMIRYLQNGSGLFALMTINDIGHFVWITDIRWNGSDYDVYAMDPWYGWNMATKAPYPYPQNQKDIDAHLGYTVTKNFNAVFAFSPN